MAETTLPAPKSLIGRRRIIRNLWALGPAFLVSVGYMDPGNWATDIEGGSRFNYELLWVIVFSTIVSIFLQTLSAKLGIATGKGLAENCRDQYPRPLRLILWFLMELAMIATDLAEFMGSAIGISLLFHIPLLPAVIVTGFDVMLILWLERYGFRAIELVIIGLIGVVGIGYIVEIILSQPAWSEVVRHMFIPTWNPSSLYLAIGIIGATVMPHNLFLHSTQIKTRLRPEVSKKDLIRLSRADTFLALGSAWLVNSAILMMAAAVFYRNATVVTEIDQAYKTLVPLLGGAAGTIFAVALLASGISSSTTGTMAGQIVMEEFLHLKIRPWKRRLVTRLIVMVPTLIAVIAGRSPLELLVFSQAILSFLLPIAVIPLIDLTSRKSLMGEFRNSRLTILIAIGTLIFLITANATVLWQTLSGG